MDILKSYLSMIDPRLLHHVSGKPGKFIRLFKQEKYISEDAFIERVCGDRYDENYYDRLKARTITILQALAIIGTPRGTNEVKKNLDNCRKFFTIGQKFLGNGNRTEGLRLTKLAYNIAVDYDFSYLACELASVLQHDHLYYHRNIRKANDYGKQVDIYLANYTAEKKAEYHFFRVIGPANKSVSIKRINEAQQAMQGYPGTSIKYIVYMASIRLVAALHIGAYGEVARICAEAIQFFSNKKGVYSSHYHFFLTNLAVAYIATTRYTKAVKALNQAQRHAPPKSLNDAIIQLYLTLNALHAGNYTEAYALFQKNRHCKFKTIHQQFIIIEAYLCFLSYTGNIHLKKAFRIGKYLNETLKAQADKQGDNINILIAELLVYLVRDRGKFIDRVEAIQHYSYKHLKNKDTRRARWFIKILCLLPKIDFHHLALERRAKRLINYIKGQPLRMGEGFAIEIIPFEKLLELVMVQLGKKAA